MVEIIFAGGEPLRVTEALGDVLLRLDNAAQGAAIRFAFEGGSTDIRGWAILTPEHGGQVLVRPAAVAYVRPPVEHGRASW